MRMRSARVNVAAFVVGAILAACGPNGSQVHTLPASGSIPSSGAILASPTSHFLSSASCFRSALGWNEAIQHVGQEAAVEGPVVSTYYDVQGNGHPTFLNVGQLYPDPSRLTVVIWEENRGSFLEPPETLYLGRTICVVGLLQTYQGAPEIVVRSPSQIAILASPTSRLQPAVNRVELLGYTPVHPAQTYCEACHLHVILGYCSGSADGACLHAFFFLQAVYLRTDTPQTSEAMRVMWHTSKTVAIGYYLYRPNDPVCCPTGGIRVVRFKWNGHRLVALDPIPTSDPFAPLSRR